MGQRRSGVVREEDMMNCTCCGTATGHEWGGVPLCEECKDKKRIPANRLPAQNLKAELRGIVNHLWDVCAAHSNTTVDQHFMGHLVAAAVELNKALETLSDAS